MNDLSGLLGRVGEHLADPPPAHPHAVGEMRLHAGVGMADDLLDRLVDALVALVPVRDRELRAFLHVDHDRHGEPRPVRPGEPGGIGAGQEVASVGHRSPMHQNLAEGA